MPNPDPIRLPRRDFVLLPLLCALTVVAMVGLAEIGTRMAYAERKEDSCARPDATLGYRFAPDCTSRTKAAEGPWVTNYYNECGYRTTQSCGPAADGVRRVAVVGSSISAGYLVPYDSSIANLTAARLQGKCDAPVEFQNLGGIGYIWSKVYSRMDEALALRPLAVMMVVIPFDLEQTVDTPAPTALGTAASGTSASGTSALRLDAVATTGVMARLHRIIGSSRAFAVAQHFLFQNVPFYTNLYLRYGDKADFLRPPFPPSWQRRFHDFDVLMEGVSAKARAAGVPFILATVPQRAQAALVASHGRLPPGIDPMAFDREVARIAARHGIDDIDVTPEFARQSNPAADYYYAVDGHINALGSQLVAKAIAQRFISDVPAFASCTMRTAERAAEPEGVSVP